MNIFTWMKLLLFHANNFRILDVQLSESVTQLAADLQAAVTEAKEKEELHTSCCERVANLEQAIKDHGRDRESKLMALEKQIKSIKQQLSVSAKELKVRSKTHLCGTILYITKCI